MDKSQTHRFWDRVDKSGDCWIWLGSKTPAGYGSVYLGKDERGKEIRVYSHRYSFELSNGYLPEVVMHTCDNPPCVNPAHLAAGNWDTNNKDMIAKGRHGHQKRVECRNGHPYLDGSYYQYGNRRLCKQCIAGRKVGTTKSI